MPIASLFYGYAYASKIKESLKKRISVHFRQIHLSKIINILPSVIAIRYFVSIIFICCSI